MATWTISTNRFIGSTEVNGNYTTSPPRPPRLDLSNWVEFLTLLTTNLSIVSSLFLLLTFQCIIQAAKRDLLICLIQCLAVANLFFCIGMDMGIAHYANGDIGKSDLLCVIQSFICTFFDMVSFWYTLFVIVYVFSVAVIKSEWMKGKRAKRIYHTVAWTIPALITISATSTGALGDAKSRFGSWCWIDDDSLSNKQRLLWMLFTKQIWEIFIYLLSASLIIITIWMRIRMRRTRGQIINQRFHEFNENGELSISISGRSRNHPKFNVMVWMLFYFYVTRIWGTTRNLVRIIGLAYGSGTVPGFVPYDEKFFIHAQSLGDSMQGTLNFLMFCYCDDNVWRQVRETINRKFLDTICCRKDDEDEDSYTVPILDSDIGHTRKNYS
ncbi:G-protein coupled receptor 157-like [Pecten maximus]|uniref:G-protein coupled receptor 157-like n=1 Tax=Pecten maximus TaxID=6579 RepID=UPI0014580588|nr:G-protein coupled receptor 157-like [Pecten maximus]